MGNRVGLSVTINVWDFFFFFLKKFPMNENEEAKRLGVIHIILQLQVKRVRSLFLFHLWAGNENRLCGR